MTEVRNDHAELQERYGLDAAEWLSRWDNNDIVWTVEMGGLGPGYEQSIQIAAAEALRIMITENFDHTQWSNQNVWDADRKKMDEAAFNKEGKIAKQNLSGAQWGAALSLATTLYMRDPWVALSDDRVKDRLVQVQREFPDG